GGGDRRIVCTLPRRPVLWLPRAPRCPRPKNAKTDGARIVVGPNPRSPAAHRFRVRESVPRHVASDPTYRCADRPPSRDRTALVKRGPRRARTPCRTTHRLLTGIGERPTATQPNAKETTHETR